MDKYKVSIIIPIYNVEPYIENCLKSVVSQSRENGIECILVDDCGKDRSIHIAEDFVNNYKGEVKYDIIHHEKNKGLSAARNTGIQAAHGEYIYFLDSDDEITPNCVSTLLSIAEEYPGIDLIQSSYLADTPYFNQFNHIKFPNYTDDRALIKRSLLNCNVIPVMAQNRLVRRALIQDYNVYFKEGIIHEDNHWTFFLAKYVRTMAYTKERTYVYNITPGSITNNRNITKEIQSHRVIIEDFCSNIDNYQKGTQRLCIFLLLDLVRKSQYYEAPEQLNKSYQQFYAICNPIERVFLKMWYNARIGSHKYKKMGNVLQHIFSYN